jgi:hypothetical protein
MPQIERSIDDIVQDLIKALKPLDHQQAITALMLAQELAEAKGMRLFTLWKQAEEHRRG